MRSTSRSLGSGAEAEDAIGAPRHPSNALGMGRERGTGLVAAVVGTMVLVTLLLVSLQVSLLLLARSETQAVLGRATADLALPSPRPFAARKQSAVAQIRAELGQAGRAATIEVWRTSRAVHGSVRLSVPNVLPRLVTDPLGLERVRTAAVARLTIGGDEP